MLKGQRNGTEGVSITVCRDQQNLSLNKLTELLITREKVTVVIFDKSYGGKVLGLSNETVEFFINPQMQVSPNAPIAEVSLND